jgi:hypothetical protein
MRPSLRVGTAVVAVATAATVATASSAQKLVAPMRGNAKVEITKPNTKVVGKEIVTTFLLKNIEAAPIAGVKIEENWFDKAGNPVMGDVFRHQKPLQPGEVITVTFKVPRSPNMQRNQYLFSHANGNLKQAVVPKIDVPKAGT